MRLVMHEFGIRYGENFIEKALANRREETPIIERALDVIRRDLERLARSGRKPFLLLLANEGATSLSIAREWTPKIEDLVSMYNGTMILFFNVGVNIGLIGEDEYKRRLDVIKEVLSDVKSPKIFTNNVVRIKKEKERGRDSELVFDNDHFDYYFMLVAYSISIAVSAKPVEADLENILQSNTIHAVTRPCLISNYDDYLRERSKGVSFTTMANLKAGYEAPFIDDAISSVDGAVIVGYSAERVKALTEAFKKNFPWIQYSSYAVSPIREERSTIRRLLGRLAPPIVVYEGYQSRSWRTEKSSLFFLAKLSIEEAIQAVEKQREILKKRANPLK